MKKGYSGVLEADLWRSEAKVEAVRAARDAALGEISSASSSPNPASNATLGVSESGKDATLPFVRPPPSTFLSESEDPKTKEAGQERWKYAMTLRFLRGEDEDFEYQDVDQSEEWDFIERREREEEWFEDEEPEFVEGGGKEGETGVQDF